MFGSASITIFDKNIITPSRAKIMSCRKGIFLLRVDEFIMLAVSDLRGIHSRHRHLAVLVESPIGLIYVVVGGNSVDLFYIKTVSAILAFNKTVLDKCVAESFLVGVDGKRNRLILDLDLKLNGGVAVAERHIAAVGSALPKSLSIDRVAGDEAEKKNES